MVTASKEGCALSLSQPPLTVAVVDAACAAWVGSVSTPTHSISARHIARKRLNITPFLLSDS